MPLHSPHSIKKNSYFYREFLFPHSYSVGGRNKIVAKYCYSKSGLVSNATEMKSEQEQDKKKNEIIKNEKKLLSQIGFGISELSIIHIRTTQTVNHLFFFLMILTEDFLYLDNRRIQLHREKTYYIIIIQPCDPIFDMRTVSL